MQFYFLDRFQPGFPPLVPGILWAPVWCCDSLSLFTYPLPQIEHVNGFSPVWYLSWLIKFFSVFSFLGQNLHWNRGPWCDSSCILSTLRLPNRLLQCLHWYLSSVEWTALSCALSLRFMSNTTPHVGQGNLELSSCTCMKCRLNPCLLVNLLLHLSQW